MSSAAWHPLGILVGAGLILLGVATFSGWIGRSFARSRWPAPRLIGIADTALGVWLLLFALLSDHLWAVLIGIVAFVIAAICVIAWVVKAVAQRADDEIGSA
jgi:predicted MFS family arabinose efflux permease